MGIGGLSFSFPSFVHSRVHHFMGAGGGVKKKKSTKKFSFGLCECEVEHERALLWSEDVRGKRRG